MISDLQKVELIQHFLEEIDDNLKEITALENDIFDMKKKIWDIINKTARIENYINLCMNEQEFVNSLCDDFITNIKNKKSKIQQLRKKVLR
jgi:archaellum component FlaC